MLHALVVVLILRLSGFVSGAPQVPCYFIFGDSLYDNGNNNELQTSAKANYNPYGIDFPAGSAGSRFSNGRNTADILAQLLGFDDFIRSFTYARGQQILKGVNYASASSGIRNETGQHLGDRICFNKQLQLHITTVSAIGRMLGNKRSAADHLNKCLYTVGFGSNDFVNNYFSPFYHTRSTYTADQYATTLIQEYSQQLKLLYHLGARKIAVFGLGAIGCTPAVVAMYGKYGKYGCTDFINHAVQMFNAKLALLVVNLNKNMKNAKFIFINSIQISLLTTQTGFKFPTTPCCKISDKFQCIPNTTPCQNRSEYIFWDAIHPTEAAVALYAGRAYKAVLPTDTYPFGFDISRLAQL